MSKGNKKVNPQIGFTISEGTKEVLNKYLSNDPFFIEQYTKGYKPDISKFLRIGACTFVELLRTHNEEAMSVAREFFKDSHDAKLLLSAILQAQEMEAEI